MTLTTYVGLAAAFGLINSQKQISENVRHCGKIAKYAMSTIGADFSSVRIHRARIRAALGEPARLAVVDALDASPGEVGEALGLATNLIAHHVKVLGETGIIIRGHSESDRRRTYLADPAGKTVDEVDVGQSTVSAHLKALAEVRFVLADQHGTARFYRINQNCMTCFPTAAAQE